MSTDTNEITYIADFGDVVQLADGQIATVINANALAGGPNQPRRYGAYYSLLFKGGSEETYYVWSDKPDVMVKSTFRTQPDVELPLFQKLDVQRLLAAYNGSLDCTHCSPKS